MVERPGVVVEPQDQRADPRPDLVLVPAEAGDRHVRGPGVLHLGPPPLSRLVGPVEALGDDPVEAGPLEAGEPVGRERAVLRRRGEVETRDAGLDAGGQLATALGERALAQVVVVDGEEVPGDVARRRPRREQPHAGLGRVDPEEEGVEVEAAGSSDDDLAIDHGPLGEGRPKRRLELGEVAVQGSQVAALHEELVAIPEDDGPEAVPLGLVGPAGPVGQRRLGLRQHRRERRREREAHARIMRDAARCASPQGALYSGSGSGGLVDRVVRPPGRGVDRRFRRAPLLRHQRGAAPRGPCRSPCTTAIAIARDTARSSETGG